MRTTVSIDEDVLLAVKDRAAQERRSVGEVLSDLARQALIGAPGASQQGTEERHGFRPLPHRGPVVSNSVIDRLREDEPE